MCAPHCCVSVAMMHPPIGRLAPSCPRARASAVSYLGSLTCPACACAEVEAGVSRKAFDLKLDQLGPYNVAFTRSGRHMLMGGRKGHLALMDWQRMHSVCEVQVGCACRRARGP